MGVQSFETAVPESLGAPTRRYVDDVGVEQCVLHVGAVATGIHPNCAADRTRHTDRPLEASEAVPDRRSSNDRQFRRRTGDHDRAGKPPLRQVGALTKEGQIAGASLVKRRRAHYHRGTGAVDLETERFGGVSG